MIHINKNKLLKVMKILSLFISITCIVLSLVSENINYAYWVISVIYTILLFMTHKYNLIYSAPGIMVMNIILFMRYNVLVLALYISGSLLEYANNYNYLSFSVFIMILEEIIIFLTILYTGKRERKRVLKNEEFKLVNGKHKYRFFIATCIIIVVLGLVTTNKNLVGGISLITKGTIEPSSFVNGNSSGLISILWQSCLAWIYIYVCFYIKEKFKSKFMWISLIISIAYILLTFIGQDSLSRWYTVISFIAVYFTLCKLYPEKKAGINAFIMIPSLVFILVISIYKNTDYLYDSNKSFSKSFITLFDAGKFDAYLAGPVSINNAIGLKLDEHLDISCIGKDIVNNMPIVNHWFDTSTNSVNMYNKYIGRYWNGSGDQILPLVGQSFVYFGFVLSPLLSVIAIFIIRYFDRKYITSNSFYLYAYAFSSAWFALSPILNMTIILSWLYIRILPLILLIICSNILSAGKIVIKVRG